MSTYKDVFNKASIYDMLFFNVKAVLSYASTETLKNENDALYQQWLNISKNKYKCDVNEVSAEEFEKIYIERASYYPEYTEVIAITYASLYLDNGELKRSFKKIVDTNEVVVLETFFDLLTQISSESSQSTPQEFPILCGHNIVGYDIPLLIKRFVKQSSQFKSIDQVPYILKRSLELKPWESGILDTTTAWKFDGYDNAPLMLISEFLGLKKTVDVLSLPELSKYYWEHINEDVDETLKYVALQSATQTNLTIQLVNELRQL